MTINCVDTNTHRRTEEHKHTQTDIETPRQKSIEVIKSSRDFFNVYIVIIYPGIKTTFYPRNAFLVLCSTKATSTVTLTLARNGDIDAN